MAALFEELKRRNVLRVAAAYTVVGWVVLQAVDVVAPILELPDWFARGILVLLAVGLPITIVISWFYEWTPGGVMTAAAADAAGYVKPSAFGRQIDFVIIALLVIAVGWLVYEREPPTEVPAASIAVLPFVNMSDDAANEYFSDGISEEILNVLSRIPNLHVTSRSSAFQFKGGGIDIPTVAAQLGVAHVLEGSVRKSGTRVRIAAQLIEASTDRHLWSATYDRELDDIFAIQDEISAAIVDALKTALGLELVAPTAKAFVADSEAHEAYLRGRHLVVQRTRQTVEGAVTEFERAIKLDPDYALAHAELAIATMLLVRGLYGGLTDSEVLARAAPQAERALALDPALAEAHAATGYVLWSQGKVEEGLAHFRHATSINPNYSIVYTWMGTLVSRDLGRYDELIGVRETALRLDPLSIPAIGNYVRALVARNRIEEAERELAKLASIAPAVHATLGGEIRSVHGQWANAVLGGLDALRFNPEFGWSRNRLTREFATIGLGREALAISQAPQPYVLNILGRSEDAVTTAEARLAEEPDSLLARRDLGLALAGAGDYARARPILEEMWQQSGGRVTRRGVFQVTHAAALIAARGAAGDETDGGELVAAIADDVGRARHAGLTAPSVDFEEGFAVWLAGQRERGLRLIARAVDDGEVVWPREAYFKALYDDPGFAPIRAAQEARQDRERDKFLAIVCANNSYAAVWQPAEGTCEGAAAGGN